MEKRCTSDASWHHILGELSLKPFYQISIKKLKLVCILYAVPWIVLYGFNVHQFHEEYTVRISSQYGYLIGAGLAETLTSFNSIILESWESPSDGTYKAFYLLTILPDLIAFLIPVIIVIVTCIIQIKSLRSSSQFPTSSNQRHVTITVLLMSTLFVLCNTPLAGYMAVCTISEITPNPLPIFNLYATSYNFITVLTATVLPILNAALNPVIIITRSSGMRITFSDSLQRMLRRVRDTPMSCWDYMVGAFREPRAQMLRAVIRLRAQILRAVIRRRAQILRAVIRLRAQILRAVIRIRAQILRAVIRIRALRARIDRIIGIGLVGLDLLD